MATCEEAQCEPILQSRLARRSPRDCEGVGGFRTQECRAEMHSQVRPLGWGGAPCRGLMVVFRHGHIQKLWFGGSSSPLPTADTHRG